MTDILQMALSGLHKVLPSRTIRYQRGDEYVDLKVTVGRTTVEYEDEHGVRVVGEIRNYLILEPDKLITALSEPQETDEIIDTGEGATRTYRLMGVEGGIVWRWTDRYHTVLRVHVREVDEA